jgi:hypothetical protein
MPPRPIRAPRGGMGISVSPGGPPSDWSQVLTDHLFAGFQQHQQTITLDLPVVAPTEPDDQGEDVRPTVGSVLHYTPDSRGWLANLSDDEGSEWQEVVVGWAVVVTWAKYAPENEDSERPEGDESEFQSEIQPALFSPESGSVELMVFREGVNLDGLVLPGVPT